MGSACLGRSDSFLGKISRSEEMLGYAGFVGLGNRRAAPLHQECDRARVKPLE